MHRADLITGSVIVGLAAIWAATVKRKGFFWRNVPTQSQRLALAAIGIAIILSGIFWK